MKKIFVNGWAWLSLAFAVCAVACIPWAPTRFGAVFFGALAVGSAGEAYFMHRRGKYKGYRMIAIAGAVLFSLFVLSFAGIQFVIQQGMQENDEIEADYLFVLGARVYEDGRPSAALVARLDRAKDYLEQYPAAKAVLCGGQGDNEPLPEARAMQTYLLASGVAEDRLLIEEASRNTIQNIANAKAMLDELGDSYTTMVVSSDFHCARARRLMVHAGLEPYAIPAETPYLAQRLVLRCREYCSILGLMVSGRW